MPKTLLDSRGTAANRTKERFYSHEAEFWVGRETINKEIHMLSGGDKNNGKKESRVKGYGVPGQGDAIKQDGQKGLSGDVREARGRT